jgi:hypothetical protein
VQELLGYADVSRTMFYAHVLNRGGHGLRSPLDRRKAGAVERRRGARKSSSIGGRGAKAVGTAWGVGSSETACSRDGLRPAQCLSVRLAPGAN